MAGSTSLTRAELLEQLRAAGEDAVQQLRATPAEAYAHGRYENGWNGREILAHIASIEWTYARLIDRARASAAGSAAPAARESKRSPVAGAAAAPRVEATERILDYNERQVQKRAGASVDELILEFAQNRERTIAAVQAADDSLLEAPIESAGGIRGTLADVLRAVAVAHVIQHVGDLTGTPWTGRRWPGAGGPGAR
jgi:uncharacterized damage-inducible protein DinB